MLDQFPRALFSSPTSSSYKGGKEGREKNKNEERSEKQPLLQTSIAVLRLLGSPKGDRGGRREMGGGNLYPAAPTRALFCQRTQRRAFKPWPFLRLLPREGRRRLQPGGVSIPACPNLPGSSRGEMRRARLAGSLPGDSGHCNAHLPAVPASTQGLGGVAWSLIPRVREVPSLSLGAEPSVLLDGYGLTADPQQSPRGPSPFPRHTQTK